VIERLFIHNAPINDFIVLKTAQGKIHGYEMITCTGISNYGAINVMKVIDLSDAFAAYHRDGALGKIRN
jgi:hypothetical protein